MASVNTKAAVLAGGAALVGLVTYLRRKYNAAVRSEVEHFDAEMASSLEAFAAERSKKPAFEFKKKSSESAASSSAKESDSASSSSSASAADGASSGVDAAHDLQKLSVDAAVALLDESISNLRGASTPLEASLEAQLKRMTVDSMDKLHGRVRALCAKWLDTFTMRTFAAIVAAGNTSPAVVKAQTGVWAMLDLTPAQVAQLRAGDARQMLVERLNAAYQLKQLPEMVAAYDALYQPAHREQLSLVEMIVLFPNAALLGRWRDVRDLGEMLAPTLKDFYDTARAMHTLPDMRLVYRLATHYDAAIERPYAESRRPLAGERDEEALKPHPLMAADAVDVAMGLDFDEWDVRTLIMDCVTADCLFPEDQREKMAAELGGPRPARKFAPGKLRIRRRGAIMMMPALLPANATVVGPFAGADKMVFSSYLTVSEGHHQHEHYELRRMTADSAAGISQWTGSYQLWEEADGQVKTVLRFELGMRLHRVKAPARECAVPSVRVLEVAQKDDKPAAAPVAAEEEAKPVAAEAAAAAEEAAEDVKDEKATEAAPTAAEAAPTAAEAAPAVAEPEAEAKPAEVEAEVEAEAEKASEDKPAKAEEVAEEAAEKADGEASK
jgi:hypothetical protein